VKSLSFILVLLLPTMLSCGEIPRNTVKEFVLSQPNIAIDLSDFRTKYKVNQELKRKNFKPGSRREQ
jgi:hypothetical protein